MYICQQVVASILQVFEAIWQLASWERTQIGCWALGLNHFCKPQGRPSLIYDPLSLSIYPSSAFSRQRLTSRARTTTLTLLLLSGFRRSKRNPCRKCCWRHLWLIYSCCEPSGGFLQQWNSLKGTIRPKPPPIVCSHLCGFRGGFQFLSEQTTSPDPPSTPWVETERVFLSTCLFNIELGCVLCLLAITATYIPVDIRVNRCPHWRLPCCPDSGWSLPPAGSRCGPGIGQ